MKIKDEIKSEKPQFIAFPIELIPKSFKKNDRETINLMQKYLKKKLEIARDDFYKENVALELECKLETINEPLDKIKQFVLDVLESSLLKSRKQVKKIKIEISNINTDPFNYSGEYALPFIGVVMKKYRELNDEEVRNERIDFNNKMREITQEKK